MKGIDPNTGDETERAPKADEPFSALVFKIATDPFVGRLAFLRAYSGKLDAGSYVLNTRSDKKERVARLYQMHSNKQNPIDFVEAGDICAAVGFKDLRTGDTICVENKPITLESMEFPDPVSRGAQGPEGSRQTRNRTCETRGRGPDIHCQVRRRDRPDRHQRYGRIAP